MERRVVTVFGGSGFIGRHLIRRLAAEGFLVRAAVRDVERAAFLKPMGDVGQVVPWPADINDLESVKRAVDGAESVVNLVGILYERGSRTFQRMHVDGAANVAEAAKQAGAKNLVQMSALGADKDSPAAYGRTKFQGEEAVKKAFPKATVLRPSVVFGPEDNFFNQFAAMAKLSPALPVIGCPTFPSPRSAEEGGGLNFYGDGGPKFQPVYVGDVADAIMVALKDPQTQGKTYELGGPMVMSFKDVMDTVLQMTGRKRLLMPVPLWLAEMKAVFLQLLPKPLLTTDQVELLKRDNVVGKRVKTFKHLGIEPQTPAAILPTYLTRYQANAIHGIQNT